MSIDFLRHIVNPILEKYLEQGRITPRDSAEIKSMLFKAEEKYKFSVYGGDIGNLVAYFESRDFADLISYLRSINALDLVVEILERTRDSYRDTHDLVISIGKAIEKLARGSGEEKSGVSEEIDVTPESLEQLLRDTVNPISIHVSRDGIRAKLDPVIELKISRSRKSFKLELRFARRLDRRSLAVILEMVKEIAKKTSGI